MFDLFNKGFVIVVFVAVLMCDVEAGGLKCREPEAEQKARSKRYSTARRQTKTQTHTLDTKDFTEGDIEPTEQTEREETTDAQTDSRHERKDQAKTEKTGNLNTN